MCIRTGSNRGLDDLEIEILADGRVKIVTGSVPAGDAHMKAEELVKWLTEQLGGECTRTKRPHSHAHNHVHTGLRIKQ